MAFSINNTTSNITLNTTVPYLVVDDEGLKAFAVNVGPPGAVGPAGADGSDAEATTDAGDLTTGTLPLGRLSGITTSQLSSAAGITSGQITSLDAGKLTGQVAAALINGGDSSQFLRGDGQFSNTLTGDFIAGEVQFLSEGPGYPNIYGGTGSGDGYLYIAAGDATQGAGNIYLYPNSALGGNSGAVDISSSGASAPVRIYHNNNSIRFSTNSTGVSLTGNISLSSAGKLIFGATGSGLAANREIYGLAGGVRTNTPTGTTITGSVEGTIVTTVSATGLAVTGAMAASGAVSGTTGTFSSNLILSGTNGLILRPTNTGYNALCGGSTEAQSSGSYIRCYGASDGSYPGQIWIVPKNGTGLYDGAFNRQAYVYSAGVLLGGACKIIYANAGTTTAANNEIVGTATGLRYNVASGLYHELLVAGTKNSQFGRAGLVASAESLSLGAWGLGATYDNTKGGIELNANTSAINIHGATSGQIQMLIGTGSSIFRMGYSPFDGGVSSAYAWGIGAYAAGLTSSYSGIGSSGDGSMTMGIATLGSIKIHANTLLRRSQTHIGGVIIADLGAPVVLANSTTTTLMTATNRYGRLEIFDSTGQWATVRISNAATPVLEAGSANFAITASPTASQLGINLSAGSLQIITGSSAGTTISVNFRGM